MRIRRATANLLSHDKLVTGVVAGFVIIPTKLFNRSTRPVSAKALFLHCFKFRARIIKT
jgi:hypothetical protein